MFESHCPVCLRICIEPVVFPCDHCVCKPCFEEIAQKSTLQCPLCRLRLGSWSRLNTRTGSLVNMERWEYIKKNFQAEVNARLAGKAEEESGMREQFSVVLSNTGEIRQEYERELHKIQEERAEQDKASAKLIQEILAQDEKELAAFRVANKENKPADSTQSVRLPLPKRSSSIDSITGEYSRHFKPIVRYPRTPPRPTANKEKGYPETIKVTPCPQTVKRLDFASSCTPPEATSSSDLSSKPGGSSSNLVLPLCISSTSSAAAATATGAAGPSCSKQSDHTFLLPLHTNSNADEQSNDGLSIVSSSTSTSLSRNRLRIETSSPVITAMSPCISANSEPSKNHSPRVEVLKLTAEARAKAGFLICFRGSDNRPSTSTEPVSRNGANSDTISYKSDASSSPVYKRLRGKHPKKNGYRNSKSSAKASAAARTNGAMEPDRVTMETNGVTETSIHGGPRSSTSKSLSRGSSRSASSVNRRGRSILGSYDSDDLDINEDVLTNGHTVMLGPAFVDRDEEYAKQLQEMYKMETKYRLTALRFKGTGNEYNTRKRKRKR